MHQFIQTVTKLGKLLWGRVSHIPIVSFCMSVIQRFGEDNGGLLAAGLAFFLVLALMPLVLVGVWALGTFFVHKPDQAVASIEQLLRTQVLPGAAGSEVQHLMARAGIVSDDGKHAGQTVLNIIDKRGLAGTIGLLTLIWTALQIFVSGSSAMNAAWEVTEKRSWIRLRVIALGLLMAAAVLIGLSLLATAVSTTFSHSAFAHIFPGEALLISGGIELAAVLASAMMYMIIFKFLPSATVSWKSALVGGLFAAVAWEIAKKGLAVYLLKPNKSLYGDLGGLIVFVLLIYYSMMILLLGAEVAAAYAKRIETSSILRLKKTARVLSVPEQVSPLSSAKVRDRARRQQQKSRHGGQPRRRE